MGTVGAAEANPGIPEGRYSNPADNQKLPILATYTDPHGKAAANISRDKTDRFSAGTMHLVYSLCGVWRAANLHVFWGRRSREVILNV